MSGIVYAELKDAAFHTARLRHTTDRESTASKRRTLLLAYDAARRKRTRLKIFVRLWLVNAKSRKLTALNVLYTTFNMSSQLLFRLDQVAAVERVNMLPDSLRMLEDGRTQEIASIMRGIVSGRYSGKDLRAVIMTTSKDVIKTMVAVQVALSLIQTILEIRYHTKQAKVDKARMQRIASGLHIENSGGMTMDELRVAVAYKLASSSPPRRTE